MSVSLWRWTEACEGQPCPGDCNLCFWEPEMDEEVESRGAGGDKMKILYLCDRLKCENCHNECKHTSDITHAINFREPDFSDNKTIYWEKEEGMQKSLDKIKEWLNASPEHNLVIDRGEKGIITELRLGYYRRD